MPGDFRARFESNGLGFFAGNLISTLFDIFVGSNLITGSDLSTGNTFKLGLLEPAMDGLKFTSLYYIKQNGVCGRDLFLNLSECHSTLC